MTILNSSSAFGSSYRKWLNVQFSVGGRRLNWTLTFNLFLFKTFVWGCTQKTLEEFLRSFSCQGKFTSKGETWKKKRNKKTKPVRLWSRLARSGNPWRQAGSPVAEQVRCAINPQAVKIFQKKENRSAFRCAALLSNQLANETYSDRWVLGARVRAETCGTCHNVPATGNWTRPCGEEEWGRCDSSNRRRHYRCPSQPMIPALCWLNVDTVRRCRRGWLSGETHPWPPYSITHKTKQVKIKI